MQAYRRSTSLLAAALLVGCGARSMLGSTDDAAAKDDAGSSDDASDDASVDATVEPERDAGKDAEPVEDSPSDSSPPDAAIVPSDAGALCGTQPGAPWPMVAHDRERTARSAFDGPRTKQTKWQFTLPYNNFSSSPAVAADGTIYLEDLGGELLALDANGAKKWSTKDTGAYGSPAIGCDGTVYVDGPHRWEQNVGWVDDLMVAVRPSGTLAWKFTVIVPFNLLDNSPVPAPGGLLYYARDGYYGLGVDGSFRFHVDGGAGYAGAREAINDGAVAFGSMASLDGSSAIAFTADGSVAWSRADMGQGAILSDGTFVGAGPTRIAGYSPLGVELWSTPASKPSSIALAADGRIYAFSSQGIISIDGSHVATLVYPWTNPYGNYPSLVIDASGWVYGSLYDRVVALRPDDSVAFELQLGGMSNGGDYVDDTSLALSQGTLYVAAYHHLWAIGP